jgi:hypothetical protein
VVAGLFIAGLAFLQYQQIVFFDLKRIEGLFTLMIENITRQISNSQNITTFVLSDFGIPLTSSMSAGVAIGLMKG